MLEDATRDRADQFHDMAMDYLEEMKESGAEDRASVARVQLDAIKWMSAVGNADRYGAKTKISGDPTSPLQIILNTGIYRGAESPPENSTPVLQESEKILNSPLPQIEVSQSETSEEATKPHSSVETNEQLSLLPETGEY